MARALAAVRMATWGAVVEAVDGRHWLHHGTPMGDTSLAAILDALADELEGEGKSDKAAVMRKFKTVVEQLGKFKTVADITAPTVYRLNVYSLFGAADMTPGLIDYRVSCSGDDL